MGSASSASYHPERDDDEDVVISLRANNGFLVEGVQTTSNTKLSDFFTHVSNIIGVPETSMRLLLPNDEALPLYNDSLISEQIMTVTDAGINDEDTLRVQVAGLLRSEEGEDAAAAAAISSHLPHASQFLLWAAREGRNEVGLAVLGGSPFVSGDVENAVVATSTFSRTPLMIAIQQIELRGWENSASLGGPRTTQRKPLIGVELVRRLLEVMAPFDIGAQNDDGDTALHYAVYNPPILSMILKVMRPRDITIRNNQRKTALQILINEGARFEEEEVIVNESIGLIQARMATIRALKKNG